MSDLKFIWSDRKRIIFGLPWTFTKYSLTEEKILIQTGILSINEEEIQLYRIMDLTLRCRLWQRLFNLGTIHCCSGDKTTPEFEIKNIKNPREVKEMLSKKIEENRDKKRVSGREHLNIDTDDDDEYDNNF